MDENSDSRRFGTGQIDLNSLPSSKEDLYMLLFPLGKSKLLEILSQLGSEYPFIAEEIRSLATTEPALRKIFVRGLNFATTSETLRSAFEVHGVVDECIIINDKTTKRSRGIGFVTYKDKESAQSALKAPGKMIDGRFVACHLSTTDSSSDKSTSVEHRKIFIGGLSPETTNEILLEFFRKHGEIENGSIILDRYSNRPRGFAFVTYKSVEAATKAVLDPEKMLCGRKLEVKFADNQKGKVPQTQFQPPVVPYPPPPPMNLVGYNYPQPMAAYPMPPMLPMPYAAQPLISYPQYPFIHDSSMASSSTGAYLGFAPGTGVYLGHAPVDDK